MRNRWRPENPELAAPELGPDLAWLLSSGAASPAVLVEALVREHYAGLYQLALEALTYPEEARRIADETVLAAAGGAARYSADQDAWDWLAGIARQRIMRRQGELAHLDCLNPSLARAYLQHWRPQPANARFLDQAVQRLSQSLGENSLRGSGRLQLKEILLSAAGIALALLVAWGAASLADSIGPRTASQSREFMGSEVLDLVGAASEVPATPATIAESGGNGALEGGPGLQSGDRIRALAFPDQPSPEDIDTSYSATRLSALNLPVLSYSSSNEDVWRRMLFSRYLWKTMWADIRVIVYGPEGYLGPARGQRHQLWVDQAGGKARLISGPLDGAPEHQVFLARQSPAVQMRSLNGMDDFARLGSQIPWFYLDEEEIVASPFLRNLFFLNHHDWPPLPGRFEVTQEATWKGRPAVIVEQFGPRGRREARYWLDRQLGIAYREQYFAGQDDDKILLEVYLLNFAFDRVFGDGLLEASRAGLPPAFARNAQGDLERVSPGWPEPFAPPAEAEPREYLPAPPGLDLGRSVLTFLPARPTAPPAAGPALQHVFVDGYYLQDILLGDAFTTLCTRSGDGMQIAFAPWPSGDGLGATLNWFRLDGVLVRTLEFQNATVSAFEFSPDSRRLAVVILLNRGQSSKIFILDTETGVGGGSPLLPPVWGLAWKPDGDALAALKAPQMYLSWDSLVQVSILDAESGRISAAKNRGEVDWGTRQVAISLDGWVARFRFPMAGLEDCSSPPGNQALLP